MISQSIAFQIVESLRKGIPPPRGVQLYSTGSEKLLSGIKQYHLSGIEDRGIIRFVSGHWGTGKTHLFRLLRELAFDQNCLVSTVELSVNETPLNKFEKVFYSILRNVQTPSAHSEIAGIEAAPFGTVLRESLAYLGTGSRSQANAPSNAEYGRACELLMTNHAIDIDFKNMIQHYWKTYVSEATDAVILEQKRGEVLKWFAGEGSLGQVRKLYGVTKLVNKENAKLMLQSLAAFVRQAGYRGLVILFDEAEMSYSVMRKSALKDAQNNLMSLIGSIDSLAGLFLIYATTPDFYTDPKHGIVTYGALSQRIGKPMPRPPRALDNVWNLDEVKPALEDYQAAANKVRLIYAAAFPQEHASMPSEEDVLRFTAEMRSKHPQHAAIHFWRLLMAAVVTYFDDHLYGEVRQASAVYEDTMARLRDD